MKHKKMQSALMGLFMMLAVIFCMRTTALADEIGDTGDTGGGWGKKGSNSYTFYYSYDLSRDAIELTVKTGRPTKTFGNTNSHTFTSPSDKTKIYTDYPVIGVSLDTAISVMNLYGGYNLDLATVKSKLNELGYTEDSKGVWRGGDGYLTYIDAVKIRPQKHTVHYDANGGWGVPADQTKEQGSVLTLSSQEPCRTGYSFKYWNASIGGIYYPGGLYGHDQDGGVVTMTAHWEDDIEPDLSSFYAIPNRWTAGNGTIGFTVQDQGSGVSSITLERYSKVTGSWSTVQTWSFYGTTDPISRTLSETSEGVYYYRLTVTDAAGNTATKTSKTIYLDHSEPVIHGLENTNTDWTNMAPIIRVNGTDYLSGTYYSGSGLQSMVIRDDSGNTVASGTGSAYYMLEPKYEGIHTWTIIARDNVGHTSSCQITTKYDITAPSITGTEITYVWYGVTYSGYCQDNIISQHTDDEASHSIYHPNCTSGLASMELYKVRGGSRTLIDSQYWRYSDTHSYRDIYHEIPEEEKVEEYYLLVVRDIAGNVNTKKLTSQRTLLTLFHTSIERSNH